MGQIKKERNKMIVEIKDLVKYYGSFRALDNFSLTVKEGEVLGLLGPNGSGKTTTINCLLSLLDFKSGSVKIFDKEMTPSAYDIKKEIGVVMQNVAVFEELNVRQNIDYFCGLYIKNKKERIQLVDEALDFVGLKEFQKQVPKKLSGGLLRRLNIACGIAHKPKLIIFDEPTVAVDPQSRNHILENIKALNKNGATIIYTTHYMEEVEILCDRIVIMDAGKEIASGTKEALKNSIQTKERIIFEVDELDDAHFENVKQMNHILKGEYKDGILTLEVSQNNDILLEVLEYFKKNQLPYSKVYSENPTLNDVFLEITGKELRD